MAGQRQRILNLMRTINEEFANQLGDQAMGARLRMLTAADPNEASGLTAAAYEVLDIACGVMSDEIAKQLASGRLTEDSLCLLLAGGPGGALLLKHIVVPFLLEQPGPAAGYA